MSPPAEPDAPARQPNPSFSPVPDAVLALVRAGRLLRADAPLLHALLTHKRRGRNEVWPRQQTLADTLGCSVRTVQRGLDRLGAAGLIAKRPRRTPDGKRARGLRYDLSALNALLPPRAPGVASGRWGAASEAHTRQPCHAESEKDVACESDTAPAPDPALTALVASLTRVGVFPSAAPRLIAAYGPERCRQALAALAQRADVRDRPAWLVACLRDGWALTPKEGGPTAKKGAPLGRPSAKAPPAVAASSPAPDPLDALPPEQYAEWEQRARAELIADASLGPVVRSSLARGRSPFLVRARMRQWLPPGSA